MAIRFLLLLASATLAISVSPGHAATIGVASLAPNDLIISEYLANPVGVGDAEAEYFEIYNATNHDVDLSGLIVRDDGSNEFTVSGSTIAPLSFAVFSSSDGAALGVMPTYVYGNRMALTNGDDEIGLYRPDDMLINKVAYDDGDWFGAGIAHELATIGAMVNTLTLGPTLGDDFVAATSSLPLGNFGSPGGPGNTRIDVPPVPLPAGAWLLMSALGMLGWVRRRVQPARGLTAS
ncbi:MAG: VPLPA-CTERM sorting domain-containing protein [Gammaproteobacteria bacterium]|nr:VPLPA-CTERM sorting domain-containing protein [Gammaproteobacteria bacterium]